MVTMNCRSCGHESTVDRTVEMTVFDVRTRRCEGCADTWETMEQEIPGTRRSRSSPDLESRSQDLESRSRLDLARSGLDLPALSALGGDNGGVLPFLGSDHQTDLGSRSQLDLSRSGLDLSRSAPAPVGVLRLAPPQAIATPKKPRRIRVSANPVYSEAFKAFWAKYPGFRKNEPDVCWEIWQRKGCEQVAADIMAALAWQVDSDQWTNDGGQYVAAPRRYLQGGGWKNERPGAPRAAGKPSQMDGIMSRAAAAGPELDE